MSLIQILSFVFLLAVLECSGVIWESLHIKFAILGGYWKMPLTIDEIRVKQPHEFQFVEKDPELNVDLYSHPQDPRFFLLFDNYGNIAGIRTGHIKADIETKAKENNLTFPYDYGAISMFKEGTYWKKDVWYTSVLFVNPQKLILGGREDTLGLVAEGMYVILDGTWVEVARDECDAEKQGFTRQACAFGMGHHYYYKTTPELDCKEFQPFFGMYEFGQLIGFGIAPFGSFTYKDGGQEWFEHVPRRVAEMIIPMAPQCTFDWLDTFEVTSLHVFLKKDARKIVCPSDNPRMIPTAPKCMYDWLTKYEATEIHVFLKVLPRLTFCFSLPWFKKHQCKNNRYV